MPVNEDRFLEREADYKPRKSSTPKDFSRPKKQPRVATNSAPVKDKPASLEERLQKEIVTPQVARTDVRDVQTAIPDEFRKTQQNLAQALAAQAAGQGPSLAQQQLKQGSDRALSQQLAMAAQARTPAQGALAQRLAMRQAGEQQ